MFSGPGAERGVLCLREVEQRNVHAEKITVFIDEVLNEAGRSYTD